MWGVGPTVGEGMTTLIQTEGLSVATEQGCFERLRAAGGSALWGFTTKGPGAGKVLQNRALPRVIQG